MHKLVFFEHFWDAPLKVNARFRAEPWDYSLSLSENSGRNTGE